jgi:lysophospholipase L1-like esterase
MRSTIAAPSRRLFLGAIAPVLAAVALGPADANIAVVGDSLAAGCPFRTLSWRPFEVINFAKGGARLVDIAAQLEHAQGYRPRSFIIDGGLNDLFGAAAPIRDIERDFRILLQVLDPGASAIFTLMPYIAQREVAPLIDAANAMMAELCRERGVEVLDINPHVSLNGVRRPDMSDDGVHFTPRANAVWIAALREKLRNQLLLESNANLS